jgi:sterol desaturase/sphingolipid hydroxylase (fatty acid hydroxylase superfamily)
MLTLILPFTNTHDPRYEAFALRRWARDEDAGLYTDWWASPVYSCAWLLLIPIWREFHFYWIHRLCHWKPLYKTVRN